MSLPAAQSAARLGSQNTTVSYGNLDLSPLAEVSTACQPWRQRRAERYEARAATTPRGARRDWYASRAAGLREPLQTKVCRCGSTVAELVNQTTGEVIEVPVGCGVRLCVKCAKRKAARTFRRLKAQLATVGNEQKRRHRAPKLLTLTVRDSVGLDMVAKLLRAAWSRFRASWRAKFKFSFTFLRFEEVTAGHAHAGHLHWHVLAWLPKWLPYKDLQRWWRKAMSRARAEFGLSADDQGQNLDVSSHRDAEIAARYASKIYQYISKDSQGLLDLSPDIAAAYLGATYGLRIFTASIGLLARLESGQWLLLGIVEVEQQASQAPATVEVATGPP